MSKGLKKLGATVTKLSLYGTVLCDYNREVINLNSFDEIFFTSPSGVDSFKKNFGKFPKKAKLLAIGEETEKRLKNET